MSDRPDDVHVMPNDDRHSASTRCHCRPVEDEQNKRAIAQGQNRSRLFVHNQVN